ncbi:MAG: hypothetical protein P8078_08335 [bacterium]
MYKKNKKYLLILTLLLFCTGEVKSQIFTSITLTGDWDLYLTQTDLQGGAGSNLNGTYTSDSGDPVLVEIYRLYLFPGFKTWNWAIDIHKQDVVWHTDLLIDARRTGDGICNQTNYSISGGTNYTNITDTDAEFFSGQISGNLGWVGSFSVTDIPIQYRIRGVSATLPSQAYSTTIYYTIRDE